MAFPYRTTLILTEQQQLWLQQESARDGITVADLVRRIIDTYRKKSRKPKAAKKERA